MRKMRQLMSLSIAVLFVLAPLAGVALADEQSNTYKVQGEVITWDSSQTQFELLAEDGRELVMKWTGDTQIEGEPSVGSMIQVTYKMNEGALIALEIRVV